MKPLTYLLSEISTQKAVRLEPADNGAVPKVGWQKMAEQITYEESLKHYPAEVLRDRWQQGRAAIVVNLSEIIAYMSLVPVYVETTRREFGRALGVEPDQLPGINVYESATNWTHPAWRQRGISLQLHRRLLKQFSGSNLYISIAAGLAVSPVLARLNWQLVAWNKIAFVSSLIGVPKAGLEGEIKGRWLPQEMKLYEGEHIALGQNTTHSWDNFCHFWVSDLSLASEMDRQLSTRLNENLQRWQKAVAAVLFTTPAETSWRPFLFDSRTYAVDRLNVISSDDRSEKSP